MSALDKYLNKYETDEKQEQPTGGSAMDRYLNQYEPQAVPAPSQSTKPEEEVKEYIRSSDISKLTEGLKVRPEVVKDSEKLVEFFGGQMEGEDMAAGQYALGFLGDAFSGSWAQKAFIESQGKDAEGLAGIYRNIKQFIEGDKAVGDLSKDEVEFLYRLKDRVGQTKSTARTVAEIGAGLAIPGGAKVAAVTRGGKLLSYAGTAAADALAGAIYASGTAKRGEELENAILYGGAGAALGAALTGAVKVGQKVWKGNSKAQKIINESIDELPGDGVLKAMKEVRSTPEFRARQRVLEEMLDVEKGIIRKPKDFIKRVRNEDAETLLGSDFMKFRHLYADSRAVEKALMKTMKEDVQNAKKLLGSLDKAVIEQSGKEHVTKVINTVQDMAAAKKVIDAQDLKPNYKNLNPITRIAMVVSDNRPMYTMIDNKFPGLTDLAQSADRASKTRKLGKGIEHLFDKKLGLLQKAAKKEGVDGKTLWEGGGSAALQKQVADFFEEFRITTNGIGANIQKRTNKDGVVERFVPHKLQSPVALRLAMEKRIKGKAFDQVDEETLNGISFLVGYKVDTPKKFKHAVHQLRNPVNLRFKGAALASTMHRRDEGMPDWLLDKDLFNATKSYISNTISNVSKRDFILELRKAEKVAKDMDDRSLKNWIKNHRADLLGQRSALVRGARIQADNFQVKMMQKAEESSGLQKRMYEGAAQLPEAVTAINNFAYANLLGLSPSAQLQNLVSPFLQNLPHMGGVYGTRVAVNAMARLANFKRRGGNLTELMQKEGIYEPRFSSELEAQFARGIEKSTKGMGAKVAGLTEGWSNTTMLLFEASEKIARGTNFFMAKEVVKDLMKGSGRAHKAARKFIDEIPDTGYRRTIRNAYAAKDEDALNEIMARYLDATAMFNYDQINKSEFGRYAGPLFSVFTKWPTSMAGKVLQNWEDKGAVEGSKYLAKYFGYPMVAMGLVSQALPDPEESPTMRALTGSKGVQGWTQMDSLVNMEPSKFLKPPMWQAMSSFVAPIYATDWDGDEPIEDLKQGYSEAIGNAADVYLPGMNIYNFATERLPMLLGKETD